MHDINHIASHHSNRNKANQILSNVPRDLLLQLHFYMLHSAFAQNRFFLRIKFDRAAIPSLCTPALRSQTPLLPSTIAMSSSATFSANISLPLPRVFRLLAASSIHCIACRRLCRRYIGMGIWRATPPPAAPFCDRIRRRGATESIASVR